MNRIRYAEKNSLCDYDLSLELFNELGININDITPLRNVFVISTDSGNKILKKVDYDEDRLNFINECLEYIKNNYDNVITYNKFSDGLSYKKWNDNLYVVMDILDGREACFTNPVEVKLCAQNVALMHKASKGLREELKNKINKDLLDESLESKFKKAYDELIFLKDIVNKYKYKNEFDTLFLKNIDKYINEIVSVQEKLKNSQYNELRESGDTVSICHNDLAYHNFLVKKDKVSIIDFDFLTLDLRAIDISDFILRCIKNSAFDIDKMLLAIDSYEEISLLKREEKELIYILLSFPKDFYTMAKNYYYKRKRWEYEVYLNRFKTKLNNEPFRKEFLNIYGKLINI